MTRNATSFKAGLPGPRLQHGARSRTVVEKRAAEVRGELTALLAQHLPIVNAADAPLVDLAVDVTTKLRLLSEYFDRTSGSSLIDLRGRPRSAAALYLQLVRQAQSLYRELGLGPAARAQLMATLGNRDQAGVLEAARSLRSSYAEAGTDQPA